MAKIGFVVPWHGESIPGGAEAALRSVSEHLAQTEYEVEILTTCVEKFTADWNKNFFKPGEYTVNGILTRRFAVRKRNTKRFDELNGKLLQNQKLSSDEEIEFMQEMVNSPNLYQYIKDHQEEYVCFIAIPYMFGTTYFAYKACPEKFVMIPCAHEEAYIHMDIYREMFENAKGMIYNAKPEEDLVNSLFDMSKVKQITPGLGMDTDIRGQADVFREKFGIQTPFILYAGRKDKGKNIDLLLRFFAEYKRRNKGNLKLVLIGGGKVDVPDNVTQDVIDLGFVDIQDKYNACAAAEFLCQPSVHESFSYVIMESWLCGRPVLVHDQCEVTKNFAIESNGGLYFRDYFEFEGVLNYLIEQKEIAREMGDNGREYVKNHFSWKSVIGEYVDFLIRLSKE